VKKWAGIHPSNVYLWIGPSTSMRKPTRDCEQRLGMRQRVDRAGNLELLATYCCEKRLGSSAARIP